MPTLRSAAGCNLKFDYKAVSSVVNSTLASHVMALGDASSWLNVYGVVWRPVQEGSMPLIVWLTSCHVQAPAL